MSGEREPETDAEVFANLHAAVNEAQAATGPWAYGMVFMLGQDGYVLCVRSLEACSGRDLREAAGLLLGHATRLTMLADQMDGTPTFMVDRDRTTPPEGFS